jgi:hypothetical protein
MRISTVERTFPTPQLVDIIVVAELLICQQFIHRLAAVAAEILLADRDVAAAARIAAVIT